MEPIFQAYRCIVRSERSWRQSVAVLRFAHGHGHLLLDAFCSNPVCETYLKPYSLTLPSTSVSSSF